MPKASRAKLRQHAPAAQLPFKRSFATGEAVEQLLPASSEVEAGTGSSGFIASDAGPSRKRTLVIPELTTLPSILSHPYSRSHIRREKRKAKQNLHGGTLEAVAQALGETTGSVGESDKVEHVSDGGGGVPTAQKSGRTSRGKDGRIGEGKGRTMREKARRKQIQIEGLRIPAVVQHPEFKKDPWATIRLHAANTLESAASKDRTGRT